jgi:hypothetical protein
MADAPASGGGSGWGALEVILALVLAIGVISTLTGNPITPIFGTTPEAKKTTTVTPSSSVLDGCTAVVTAPANNGQIDTVVSISGSFTSCSNGFSVPSSLNAQVVDSTGGSLSAYTPVPVTSSPFGNARFSATVQLAGVAHSTSAILIITGNDGSDIRIPIKLTPRNATSTYTSTITTTNTIPTSTTPVYYTGPTTAPVTYIAPAPVQQQQQQNTSQNTNTNTNQNSGSGGGSGTTF